jgi:hypothetical protein
MVKMRCENRDDDLTGSTSRAHEEEESADKKEKVDDDENRKIQHESVDAPAQAKLVETYYEYLVLISIILIIFAAFRNSVTW